ncbi:MAG: ferritin-like domain-containing protein, partial [Pirellulales bacterium]
AGEKLSKSRTFTAYLGGATMKLATMDDLLHHELKDLYSAEKQLIKALPKMAKAASSQSLAELVRAHLEETHEHVQRLERIFEQLGKSTRGAHCKAMEGLIEEAGELLEEDGDPAVKDAAMIAAAQRVEHYEIAGYGSARTFAQQLGYDEAADLLQQTLDEEHAADDKLNNLALSSVNEEAQAAAE